MTPKEKAQELILMYLKIENSNEWWSKVPAKECALITVDEIMDLLYNLDSGEIYYWESVKRELYNL